MNMKNSKHLKSVVCYKCGASLEDADITVVLETPLAFVAHATCPVCKAQSMLMVTQSGVGAVPLVSDLAPEEINHFLKMSSISYDEILDLHEKLKDTKICDLLQQQENTLAKKPRKLGKIQKSQR